MHNSLGIEMMRIEELSWGEEDTSTNPPPSSLSNHLGVSAGHSSKGGSSSDHGYNNHSSNHGTYGDLEKHLNNQYYNSNRREESLEGREERRGRSRTNYEPRATFSDSIRIASNREEIPSPNMTVPQDEALSPQNARVLMGNFIQPRNTVNRDQELNQDSCRYNNSNLGWEDTTVEQAQHRQTFLSPSYDDDAYDKHQHPQEYHQSNSYHNREHSQSWSQLERHQQNRKFDKGSEPRKSKAPQSIPDTKKGVPSLSHQYSLEELGFDPSLLPSSISRISIVGDAQEHAPPSRVTANHRASFGRDPSTRPSSTDKGGRSSSLMAVNDEKLLAKDKFGSKQQAADISSSRNRIQQLVQATKSRKATDDRISHLDTYNNHPRNFYNEDKVEGWGSNLNNEEIPNNHPVNQHGNFDGNTNRPVSTERQPRIKEIPDERPGYVKVAERRPFERAKPREDPRDREYSRYHTESSQDQTSRGGMCSSQSTIKPVLAWQLEGEPSELSEGDEELLGPTVEKHEELMWKEEYETRQIHFYGKDKKPIQSNSNRNDADDDKQKVSSANMTTRDDQVNQQPLMTITCPSCHCIFNSPLASNATINGNKNLNLLSSFNQ